MFRTALWTWRQPRYAAMSVGLLVVSLVLIAAGSWEISAFAQKVRTNDALRHNLSASAVPLTTELVPLSDHGVPAPGRNAIRFRTVTTSGVYVGGAQEFVRNEVQHSVSGYYVLAPVRTADGVLLVVRGFVAPTAAGFPPRVSAPPSGLVHLTGRLQTAATKHDAAGTLANGEIKSVNPSEQAARLATPVFAAYLILSAHQPGTAGVKAVTAPSHSNPAGGATEQQEFGYIVVLYAVALMTLAAPTVMARSEIRDAQQRYLGVEVDRRALDMEADPSQPLQLTAGDSSGTLTTRDRGTLAPAAGPTPEQWARAARLADRYGRSLGVGPVGPARTTPTTGRFRRAGTAAAVGHDFRPPNAATRPSRSDDAFHGAYNDYLWQLGLADAETPDVTAPDVTPPDVTPADTDDATP